ncbi:ABC transporter ATP-binding protein [Paenibacillus albidus]|uniref:ABC transporter ATP-binding protein n=1 Tax=Paenibacillus albidus TaxID=2041023 RepID=UPI001BEA0CE0|nr:ABC transporter ATP-binding protein [Paenibacillus albidus]MBT2292808.1 ABC transporter ATP-binding protein [Paenibacillus albidus]
MNEMLKIEALSKTYGDSYALQDVHLSIMAGDICAVIGKNGAGKTTLFKCITEQVFPTGGSISFYGKRDVAEVRQERCKMGTIIEEPAFYPDFTARQNLEYYRQQRGIAGKAPIDQALREVGLLHTGKKKFKVFSMGMKQRLGIALALMSHPTLLILDEPTNGLDPEGKAEIRLLLQRLNRERNVTMLISSHVLSELQSIATRYIFIDQGRIVEALTAKELLNKTQRTVELVVKDSAQAAPILDKHFPDIPYQILPDHRIQLFGGVEQTEWINRVLHNQNVAVVSINVKGEDLEAYYLSLLGGEWHA